MGRRRKSSRLPWEGRISASLVVCSVSLYDLGFAQCNQRRRQSTVVCVRCLSLRDDQLRTSYQVGVNCGHANVESFVLRFFSTNALEIPDVGEMCMHHLAHHLRKALHYQFTADYTGN